MDIERYNIKQYRLLTSYSDIFHSAVWCPCGHQEFSHPRSNNFPLLARNAPQPLRRSSSKERFQPIHWISEHFRPDLQSHTETNKIHFISSNTLYPAPRIHQGGKGEAHFRTVLPGQLLFKRRRPQNQTWLYQFFRLQVFQEALRRTNDSRFNSDDGFANIATTSPVTIEVNPIIGMYQAFAKMLTPEESPQLTHSVPIDRFVHTRLQT